MVVIVRGLRHDRLVDRGVERVAGRRGDLFEPVRGERVAQLSGDELQARDELTLLVPVRRLESAAHVVDDRQQRLDDVLAGAQAQLVGLASHALAVVLELGLKATEMVEVVVALGRESRREVVVAAAGDGLRSVGLVGRRCLGLGVLLRSRRPRGVVWRRPACASCRSSSSRLSVRVVGRAAGPARRPRRPAGHFPTLGLAAFFASTAFFALTSIRFGFSSSTFGTVTVRMPSS